MYIDLNLFRSAILRALQQNGILRLKLFINQLMARGRRGRSHGIGRRHHRHGFGRRHHFLSRRRFGYRRGYGSGRDAVAQFETRLDRISLSATPPLLVNGMLTIAGRDTSVTIQLDTFDLNQVPNYQPQNQEMMQNMWKYQEMEVFHEPFPGAFPEPQQNETNVSEMQFQQPIQPNQGVEMNYMNTMDPDPNMNNNMNNMNADPNMNMNNNMNNMGMNNMNNMMGAMGMDFNYGLLIQPTQFQPTWTVSNGVTHLNMTAVGQKVQERNSLCQILTMCLGVCFIFPLFFTCCMWWKNIVYPKYEVSEELYRAVSRFCRRSPHCTVINLTVADNGFNMEKARLLHEGLAGSTVQTFNFINMAIACNYKQNEADNFAMNVGPLKDLTQITTSLSWGDMTL